MQFDAREAKLLAPGAHIIMDDYPGLRLKASATGRSWIYRYKSPVDGKMRQIKIGNWPALSAPAAIVKWEELKLARDGGSDPSVEKKAERVHEQAAELLQREVMKEAKYTVAKLCDDYIAGHIVRHRKPKGASEVARMFRTMLGDFGSVPAAAVGRNDAFTFLERFMDIPVQGANIRRELGAAWDYALDAGRLPDTSPNWWRLVMKGRFRSRGKAINGEKVGTAKRVLSEAELSVLLPWMPNFSRMLEDVLTLYMWTGQRGAEIVAMRGDEITEEVDGLWWTIPKAKTKNARHENAGDQRVPLIGRAVVIVKRRREREGKGYLFPNQKKTGHVDQKTVQSSVYMHQPYAQTRPDNYRPRLPVGNWAPHDLRRTSRTLLASLGCPEEIAEAILGHMKPGIVGVYNRHSYEKERRYWLSILSEHLEGFSGARGTA
jgi:integrase